MGIQVKIDIRGSFLAAVVISILGIVITAIFLCFQPNWEIYGVVHQSALIVSPFTFLLGFGRGKETLSRYVWLRNAENILTGLVSSCGLILLLEASPLVVMLPFVANVIGASLGNLISK